MSGRRNRWRYAVAIWLSGLAAGVALGGVWYVDDDAPNDPGPGDSLISDPNEDGSAAHPFDAVQEATDAADPNDVVELADGAYTGDGNRDLDFSGKAITVRSASGDAAACVIDCEGEGRGFFFHSGEGTDSVVEGLMITNGSASGGAVFCYGSSPTLANCTMSGNSADDGGGVYCDWYSSPTLTNCTISGNLASRGGGVYCNRSTPTLTNCTISGNSAYAYGGGVYCDWYSSPTLTNCVVWSNAPQAVYASGGNPFAAYCNIEGSTGQPWFGDGCLDIDPLLTPDGHLTVVSPCIGAADPAGDYSGQTDRDGEPRAIGGSVDMGSDEWLDTDVDGLPDWWEQLHFGDPLIAEPFVDDDSDGRSNLEEYERGTDPLVSPRTLYVDLLGDDAWDGLAPVWDGQHGPKATIQAAIDACLPSEGDEVVIADGTYTGDGNRDLDFRGKAITVRSASGDAAACVIDCEGEGRGFFFHSGEGTDSVVEGLMITNGSASGGAVFCYGSSPTLANCTISGNSADDGGGVYCYSGSPTLTNCTISGNSADDGAGVYCYASSPTLANCTITGNSARRDGGGVYCYRSSPMLTNCKISENSAYNVGGGVYCDWYSSPTLTNCTISGNSAYDGGGGICCAYSSPTLTNCTISGNLAYAYGGGVYCYESSPTLTNCVVWSNAPQAVYVNANGGIPFAAFCNIEGGTGQPWFGEGCVDVAPLLTPDGHLTGGSPCIGAADPAGDYSGQTDRDGEPRAIGGSVDMGSDEWLDTDVDGLPDWWEQLHFGDPLIAQPFVDDDSDGRSNLEEYEGGTDPLVAYRTLYVNLLGDDAWDGLAPVWDGQHGPKATIQAAIDACLPSEGDEVVIADGTYTGDGNRDLDFRGKAITVRSASGDAAACVIDCEGEGRGFFFHSGEGTDSVVEGLMITNGSASGGAVFCYGSSPTLANCTISGHSAYYGGGVFCHAGTPTLTNCTISGNSARDGGGVYCESYSSPTLTNCTISGNSAYDDGGGVYCDGASNPTLTNCTISGNSAYDGGGGFCCAYSSPTLINCTISGNSAYYGGGFCCYWVSSPTLTNCVVWSNAPQAIYAYGGTPVAAYCNIEGGTGQPWFGEGCLDVDPLLAPDGHVMANSPCIDAGSDAALPPDWLDLDSNGDVTEPIPFDIDGDPRLLGAQVDMGADEFLDSDGDDLPDWWERKHYGDATAADSMADSDGDLVPNHDEYVVYASNPLGGVLYVSVISGDDVWDGSSPFYVGGNTGPKRTIQAALDIAASGDSVLVAAGTYAGAGNFELDFHERSIAVRAYEQPGPTVIDCGWTGQAVGANSLGTATVVLDGFDVRNGAADTGGAVNLNTNRVQLRNCALEQSAAFSAGGGFACSYALPGLHNMTLRNNAAPDGSAARMVSSHAYLADRLRVETGELLVESSWFTGPGELSLAYGTLMLVAQSADAPATVFRTDISGKGDIWIEEDAELRIEQGATVDLSGHTGSGCADPNQADQWGTITIEGALVVRDATIQNTNVDVKLADFEGHNDIVNNNISLLESSEGFGGEFWVEGNSLIRCNYIVSEGDRYLDLDPDPNVPEDQRPTLEYNTIHVLITQGAGGERGELLELRAQDYDCGGPHNPDCTSGAFQAIGSPGFTDDPSENWVLKTLEILPDCKLSLTNRQHFDFQQDPNHRRPFMFAR